MIYPKIKEGDSFTDINGLTCVVVEYIASSKIKVEYEDGHTQYRTGAILRKSAFHKGGRRGTRSPNPDYETSISHNLKEKHTAILRRLFKDNSIQKNSSYTDSTISDDWLDFNSFHSWAVNQVGHQYKDWHIDKDILVKGNKHYSSETCCFVPLRVNILFTTRASKRGAFPIGVHQDSQSSKYIAACRDGSKRVMLGRYSSPEEAFKVYKAFKENVIKSVAEEYKSIIDPKVYDAMISYEVEITD
jgi:hypothetical protein